MNIDLDRGVTMRNHPGGFRVCMYKDAPGVYFDMNGQPVTEAVARAAGFDVDHYALQRQKKEKLGRLQRQVEREFAMKSADMERLLEGDVSSYRVRKLARGNNYGIFDSDGTRLTQLKMTREEAEELLADLQGHPVDEPKGKSADDATDGEGEEGEDGGEGAAVKDDKPKEGESDGKAT